MLRLMRKHAKYFYVLFFVVILSFIFWGVGTVDKTGTVQVVAEVGKYKISAEDYWQAYDRAYHFYREIYKDKFDEDMAKKLNLKETVLNSMIDERVLLIAAQEAGIGVSDEELQEAIEHEPAFMNNGVFNKEIYVNRLRLNRMTPEAFEKIKRQELTLTKMKNLIQLSADVTDADLQSVKTSGDEKAQRMIGQAILSDIKDKAVKSYVEGLKKGIKITVNEKLIS
jgi:parvulin-like peptidyl-prolyl isomerase